MGLSIEVCSVLGEKSTIQVRYTDTVANLKDKVEQCSWCRGRVINLVHRGNVLENSKCISQTCLREGDRVVATTTKSMMAKNIAHKDKAAEDAAGGDAGLPPEDDDHIERKNVKCCAVCGATLNLVAQSMPCRCSLAFCDKHRAPERHNCTVDHGLLQKKRLADTLLPSPGAGGPDSGLSRSGEQATFVYSRFCATHRHKRGRQLHAAAFASVLVGLISAIGSDWDGVGVPTWAKRLLAGTVASCAFAAWAHSEDTLSSASRREAHEYGNFCLWSKGIRTHPWQCLMAECWNFSFVVIDAVTNGSTNCLTPYCTPWLRLIER